MLSMRQVSASTDGPICTKKHSSCPQKLLKASLQPKSRAFATRRSSQRQTFFSAKQSCSNHGPGPIALRETYRSKPGRSKGTERCQALPEAWHALAEATLARDAAAVFVSALGGFLVVKLFNVLQQQGILQQKTTRKCVHIAAGPGLLLCWPLYSIAPYARFFAALVPALNMLRLLLIGTGIVKDEATVMAVSREGSREELLRGPLYYVLVLMAVTLLFWRQSPIGITVVALMCGGDGLADLVGRRFGSAKLPFNQNKSWAGSLAMFLGGWGLAVALIALFDHIGLFECTVSAIAGSVAIIAAGATIIESLPINQWLDDNLSVPVLSAILGQYLFASSVILLA